MFDKKIVFRALPPFDKDEEILPEPIKRNLPTWYKKLTPWQKGDDTTMSPGTLKRCVPFMDALTSGYVLKNPTDIYFEHVIRENGKPDLEVKCPFAGAHRHNIISKEKDIFHHKSQIHGDLNPSECPLVGANNNFNFFKILNPYHIVTPKGYSTLFIPLLNRPELVDKLEIIAGIVDTDVWNQVNFPVILKKVDESFLLKKGTPIVQVIPFKRDQWKMEIETMKFLEEEARHFKFTTKFRNFYRSIYGKKKWN